MGISICWNVSTTPRSAAHVRSAPQPHDPLGNLRSWPSGASDQDRFIPGAPFCLPLDRFGIARPLPDDGGVPPGRSSLLGGIEEFPLFRDSRCSSRANRADRSW